MSSKAWPACGALFDPLFWCHTKETSFFSRCQAFLSFLRPSSSQTKELMEKQFYVYILASKRNGTLYIGVTSDLLKRIWEHKNHLAEGNMLVYYELHENADNAITREKKLKHWNRTWKIRLIEKHNPAWRDLYDELLT